MLPFFITFKEGSQAIYINVHHLTKWTFYEDHQETIMDLYVMGERQHTIRGDEARRLLSELTDYSFPK